MLPLSGAPSLLILGREVSLGSGYADLVGVEISGRPVIIEVKLRNRFVLRPLLRDEDRSLVDLYNEGGTAGRAYVLFWRSVFERRAPDSIDRIESLSGMRLGQGNWTQNFSDDLLQALTEAYAEAVG